MRIVAQLLRGLDLAQICIARRCLSSPALRPDLDFDYLLDVENLEKIRQTIKERKGIGDIDKLHHKWDAISKIVERAREAKIEEAEYRRMWDDLYDEALLIPNTSHHLAPKGDETKCEVVEEWGEKSTRPNPSTAEQIVHSWRSLLHPTDACGQRSYAFIGALAELEKALLDYVYDSVLSKGFRPVVVPDLVSTRVTQACGVMQREGQHSIQYVLTEDPSTALSGTAEMGISALLLGRTMRHDQLPLRLVSRSRCFRPEISKSAAEAKLYRVHEFTKVEMFVVCTQEQSEKELENIVNIQKEIFKSLELNGKLLNMSTEELGASASRKFDIEAYMPGRKVYGEVSSASNCTDFQARRLNIRYTNADGDHLYAHTCNGTAIASTRALIALLETCQDTLDIRFSLDKGMERFLHKDRRGLSSIPEVIRSRLPEKRQRPLRFQKAAPLS